MGNNEDGTILGFRGLVPHLADVGKLIELLVERRDVAALGLAGLLKAAAERLCTQAPDDPEDYRRIPQIEPVPMFALAWIEDPEQAVARGWSNCEEGCDGVTAGGSPCGSPVGFHLAGDADEIVRFVPFALVVDGEGVVTRLCEDCAGSVVFPAREGQT